MGRINGVEFDVQTAGHAGAVTVTFAATRDGVALWARASIPAGRPLRLSGEDQPRTVAEASEDEAMRMAAQELIGSVEGAPGHVAPLERALSAAVRDGRSEEAEALAWAVSQARGRRFPSLDGVSPGRGAGTPSVGAFDD